MSMNDHKIATGIDLGVYKKYIVSREIHKYRIYE